MRTSALLSTQRLALPCACALFCAGLAIPSAATAAPSDTRSVESLQEERERLDQTVWAMERRAQEHEEAIIALWDELLQTDDPYGVAGDITFDTLSLPTRGTAESLDHGIERTLLAEQPVTLNVEGWKQRLAAWKAEGYQVDMSEWHHAAFAQEGDEPATSTVSMTLYLSHPGNGERLQVNGALKVTWSKTRDDQGKPVPAIITADRLTLDRRQGPPAFEQVFELDARSEELPALPNDERLPDLRVGPVLVEDLNGDHLNDIVLAGRNLLLTNRGDFQFTSSPLCRVASPSPKAAVLADLNGDGRLDYLVAGRTMEHPRLYLADESGVFSGEPTEITATEFTTIHTMVITAGDVDADGDLDLFLGQHVSAYQQGNLPTPYFDANDGAPAVLLLNNGDATFEEGTIEAGLAPKRYRRTYAASFVDLDEDLDLDLLVTSDFSGIDVYTNNGSGVFSDVSATAVDETANFGMAHAFADFDLDGQLDFYVTGMGSTTARRLEQMGLGREEFPEHNRMRMKMGYGNRMYVGLGKGNYRQPAWKDEVARTGWSWGTSAFDFDNDADPDLYVANGHISGKSTKDYCTRYWCHDAYTDGSKPDPALATFLSQVWTQNIDNAEGISWNGYEKNAMLMNAGGNRYVSIASLLGASFEYDSRNVVADDLDNDGRVDLLVVEQMRDWQTGSLEMPQKLHVYANRLETPTHWIGVQVPHRAGRSPLGAMVRVHHGSRSQVRPLVTGDSFQSQHPARLHFGLGADETVDEIVITWLDGSTSRLEQPAVDTYHEVPSPETPAAAAKSDTLETSPSVLAVAATPAVAPSEPTPFDEERASLDETVWAKEVDAQEHEATFFALWDQLREAENPYDVARAFPLNALRIATDTRRIEHEREITELRSADGSVLLDREAWLAQLDTWESEGYELVQSEWHHPRFDRDPDGGAHSTLNFSLHVLHPPSGRRIQVSCEAPIDWQPDKDETTGLYKVDTANVVGAKILLREGPPVFREVLRIDARDLPGAQLRKDQTMGTLLVEDLDADRDPDILLTDANLRLRNRGDGTFDQEPISQDPVPPHHAALLADLTGDGIADLVCAGRDLAQPVLYPGVQGGTFESSSRPLLPDADLEAPFASCLTAGDIDGDGDLDLWLAQYIPMYVEGQMPTPFYDANDGQPSYLLINKGDGTFNEETIEAGLAKKRYRRTYGASFVDLDEDGDLDLLVTSDFAGTDVYVNDGKGFFTDETSRLAGKTFNFGMSHSLADFDADGHVDVYVTGMASTTARRLEQMGLGRDEHASINDHRMKMAYGNRLYLGGDNLLREAPFNDNVNRTGWSWGSSAADLDNDGDPDLVVVNGHISGKTSKDYCTRYWCHDIYTGTSGKDPELASFFNKVIQTSLNNPEGMSWNGYEKNVVFLNEGEGRFTNVSFLLGLAGEYDSRNLVTTDLNGDGRLDVLVVEHGRAFDQGTSRYQILHVYLNEWETDHAWIALALEGAPGVSPIGATVEVLTGSRRQVATHVTGDSYKSQHPPVLHFGLGKQTGIDSITVTWPNGSKTVLENPAVRQVHVAQAAGAEAHGLDGAGATP